MVVPDEAVAAGGLETVAMRLIGNGREIEYRVRVASFGAVAARGRVLPRRHVEHDGGVIFECVRKVNAKKGLGHKGCRLARLQIDLTVMVMINGAYGGELKELPQHCGSNFTNVPNGVLSVESH